jgi:hypothetical protein
MALEWRCFQSYPDAMSRLAAKLRADGIASDGLVGVSEALGIDVRADLELGSTVSDLMTGGDPLAGYYWNQGNTYLRDLVEFLMVEDRMQVDPAFAQLFAPVSSAAGSLLKYGWTVQGEERRQWLMQAPYFDLRPQEQVFPMVAEEMCHYLEVASQ